MSTNETVVLPKHYAKWAVEPIRFIMLNDLPYAIGNIIKYLLRWKLKDGIIDLYKAIRYLDQYVTQQEQIDLGLPVEMMDFDKVPSPLTILTNHLRRNKLDMNRVEIAQLRAYLERKEAELNADPGSD